MPFQKKQVNFGNVASGATTTVRLPVGPTYDRIAMRFLGGTGAGLANVTNVRLLANGKVIQEYADLSVLDDLNKYHGRDAAAGGAPFDACFYFRRPEIKSFTWNGRQLTEIDAERITSLRTRNLDTLTMEFTPNGTYSGASPANTDIYTDEVPDVSEDFGLITKVKKFSYPFSGAGDFPTLFDIPRGPRIMAIHYKTSLVTKVSLLANSVALMDNLSIGALQKFQDYDGKVPVAAYAVLDFIQNGNMDEALRTAALRDLRAIISVSGAITPDVYVEYLDTFNGL